MFKINKTLHCIKAKEELFFMYWSLKNNEKSLSYLFFFKSMFISKHQETFLES